MAIMSIGDARSRERPLTVEDLAGIADDERYRYELVDGRLEVSPSPTGIHERVQHRLEVHLENAAPEGYEILSDPGVTMNGARTRHRRPDLAVLRAEDFEERYITRPPLLVVEVESPESAYRDAYTKRQEYAEFGIPAYWIIYPYRANPGIVELRLDEGHYQEVTGIKGEETFETDLPFPIRFVPYWLVADGDWKKRLSGE